MSNIGIKLRPISYETCYYWEPFSGVCVNADSPMCADFTEEDDLCAGWKGKLSVWLYGAAASK